MNKVTKIDWDIINSRAELIKEKNRFKTLSIGFLAIVLEQFFPDIETQMKEVITDGPDDRGVDALHIIEGESHAEVYIFQSKYRENYANCNKTINEDEIRRITSFLNQLFDKSKELKNCNNFQLSEAVDRLWSLHEKGKICNYKIIVCSNGQGFSNSSQDIISAFCDSYSQVSFEFYGASQIISCMALETKTPENGELQVIGKEILERSDGDIRGAVASIDATSFINLIKRKDGIGIKRHLFDDNLRVFLGLKGGYNNSIISTATSKDSYLFWYLNNGITITCKNFSYNKGHAR